MRSAFFLQKRFCSSRSMSEAVPHYFFADIAYSLTNACNEEQLYELVHDAFDKYGRCYVKIRYDKQRQPFAFVQYEVGSQPIKFELR